MICKEFELQDIGSSFTIPVPGLPFGTTQQWSFCSGLQILLTANWPWYALGVG